MSNSLKLSTIHYPLSTTSYPLSTTNVIVGTAGHIDHGKTSLVRALTGVETDRLPEEKRRGITIDLGFAELDLGDVRIGFVDVPGHERFVKNMLAGAHGIDAVMLVIAADEGVMPQTREHFDICRLLGVKTGCVCLTKTDIADDELRELVRAETEELVAGSFLDGAPVVETSARSGVGLDELKNVLRDIAASVPSRENGQVTRLPIDRAFSVRGFGAVVTGTLIAGDIAEGTEMEVLPSRTHVRVRGVQVHAQTVARAVAGERTAINLGGIDTDKLERGMTLAPVNRLHTTQVVDARVEVLSGAARALKTRARVRVHAGAAEVLGRVVVLEDANEIAAGESGFVQLRLESPVTLVLGERFIIRSYSPAHTVAGGVVIDTKATRHRRREREGVRARLAQVHDGTPATQLLALTEAAGESGQSLSNLAALTGWTDDALGQALSSAVESGALREAGSFIIANAHLAKLTTRMTDALTKFHKREPLARGLGRETLREQIFNYTAPEIFRLTLAEAEGKNTIVSERDVVRLASHTLDLSSADEATQKRIEGIYLKAGLEAPTLEEALAQAASPNMKSDYVRKLARLMIDKGTLVRVSDNLFIHSRALADLRARLSEYARAHEPERAIDVAGFKDLANVSRKYAIPLLEFFDRERTTERHGDCRRILL
ncbi:MAG: selenocysteine-specific translation elongation factor [Pyrinomonadaceae bacterium MAG19_C2-C3]|nr:selenocysteine-specific translation elongation factor [Pyrinomonadaceae bacterium MAG19_C2-C3]